MTVEQTILKMYPISNREKTCAIHRRKMEYKREQLRKRLIQDGQKKEITGMAEGKREVLQEVPAKGVQGFKVCAG